MTLQFLTVSLYETHPLNLVLIVVMIIAASYINETINIIHATLLGQLVVESKYVHFYAKLYEIKFQTFYNFTYVAKASRITSS